MDIQEMYQRWVEKAVECSAEELAALGSDPKMLEDAFCADLSFGTAGLRGILGPGPNRMNVYSVGKATQGLADYLNANFENPSIAIARDSRNCGDLFVKTVAGIMAANGVRSYVYPRVMPTPALSFAVRDLGCSAGVNVTASHNPAEYNGYKVYGADGCQITTQAAKDISAAIKQVDPFDGVKKVSLEEADALGLLTWITEETVNNFIDAVAQQAIKPAGKKQAEELQLVYTPLNGTGLECVSRILSEIGIEAVTVVPEQAHPDGDFPTCPYPNPEAREALLKGLELCEDVKPDLLLATDPDADRVGIAVAHEGAFELLSGNEVGVLLLDYIAQMRKQHGQDLSDAIAITTIVSSAMVDALAQDYGFQLRRTLTGFKWMGEQIGQLEAVGKESRFMFGFEESYGYLAGTHVRDKDAVVASMLICLMARWHKSEGRDLVQAMNGLYDKYGYYLNRTISISYPGVEGAAKMKALTAGLRENPPAQVASLAVEGSTDYAPGAPMPVINAGGDAQQMLPGADVLEYRLEGGSKLLIRPSGTEPKIKAYVFAKSVTRQESEALLDSIEAAARELLA